MKAIRVHAFGEPDLMAVEEIPEPKPGPSEVLVKVHFAGVNPVDAYIRSGTYHIRPPLPYTPGLDGAGTVEQVGHEVEGVDVGDHVYIGGSLTGTYAQKVLCLPSHLHPLPENVTFAQGAALNIPYTAACYALFHRAKALPGEIVLIHGATGGVGLAAVQFALASGMVALATGGTKEGRRLLKEQGVQHIFDHHGGDYKEKILEATGGVGADIILEMRADVNLADDLTLLAKGGRVVVVGSRGPIEINPREAMVRNASILGMLVMNASTEEQKKIHSAIYQGLERGALSPVIDTELPLAQAPEAHRQVMRPGRLGKIILNPAQ